MKSFKNYITESYKLPALQTLFGTRSTPKNNTDVEQTSSSDKIVFDPILSTSHMKESVDTNDVTKPHTDEEIKKFHAASRLKDQRLSADEAQDHPGWLKMYTFDHNEHENPNNALWHHHNNTKIDKPIDQKYHEKAKTYSHEITNVIAKHKTPHDFTVFSGISQGHAERLKNRNSPSKFHHPAFLSSSTDYEQAVKFTGGVPKSGEENHVLKIHLPKGTQAGSIKHLSNYKKENEVLLNRGHDLEIHHEPTVIDHPKKGKVHIWHAKVVDHNPQKLNQKPIHEVLPDDLKPLPKNQ